MIHQTEIKENDQLTCVNTKALIGNDVGPPLKEEDYKAKQVYECACGQKHIDVGLKSNYNYVRCYNCEAELPNCREIHWCHPTRFVLKK